MAMSSARTKRSVLVSLLWLIPAISLGLAIRLTLTHWVPNGFPENFLIYEVPDWSRWIFLLGTILFTAALAIAMRRELAVAAIVSLLLLVALLSIWLRSRTHRDTVEYVAQHLR